MLSAFERLEHLEERLHAAAARAGRKRTELCLIAVSKTFSDSEIRPFLEGGQREFGENRLQEVQKKWPLLKEEFPETQLHFIGRIQSNKARDIVKLCSALHTLDRDKIAEALQREGQLQKRMPLLFVQVNTGEEAQKAGVLPREVPRFLGICSDAYGLTIAGLMCIPPFNEKPEPHFALLQRLAEKHALAYLSMGMSSDFETAIHFGATHLRVGSALFGSRSPPKL